MTARKPKPLRCDACGRFINPAEAAPVYHEPANHFGPERDEWLCRRCEAKEADDMDKREADAAWEAPFGQ